MDYDKVKSSLRECLDKTKDEKEKLERDPKTGKITKGVAQDTNKNGTVGRPKVVDTEVLQKLSYVFGLGGSIREACYYAGISESTYYTYTADNPEKKEYFDMLKEKPILAARTAIIKKINGQKAIVDDDGNIVQPYVSPDADLALRYLERKRKDEFSLRTESINTNITVDDILAKFDSPENEITDRVLHKEQEGSED